jgi:hypothetical protein
MQTDDFCPSQIVEVRTRMSAAITFSKTASHSSRSQPYSVMSGHTPVAMSGSTVRTTSTGTPFRSMIAIERSARPWGRTPADRHAGGVKRDNQRAARARGRCRARRAARLAVPAWAPMNTAMLRALSETDQRDIGSLPGGYGSDVLDVDRAGDHLVSEVRDYRRDERQPILALVGDQHSEMLGLAVAHRLSSQPEPNSADAPAEGRRRPCVPVYGGYALRLKPRRAILSGSDTRPVYGRTDLNRSAP